MPESKKRKQPVRPPGAAAPTRKKKPSPVWFAPLMLTFFGIGILWLVVFYLTSPDMPLFSSLGNGNLLVGFAFIVTGFVLSTQWR